MQVIGGLRPNPDLGEVELEVRVGAKADLSFSRSEWSTDSFARLSFFGSFVLGVNIDRIHKRAQLRHG